MFWVDSALHCTMSLVEFSCNAMCMHWYMNFTFAYETK